MVIRFLCLLICVGIFLAFRPKILYLIKSLSLERVGRRERTSKLKSHLIRILMVVTNGKHVREKLVFFFILTAAIFFFMGFVLIKTYGPKGVPIVLLMGAIPYIFLRARLYLKQVNGSFEGEQLLAELVNQYKLADKNIYEAIDGAVLALDDSSQSKKALFQLKLRLASYMGEEELREALIDFTANWETIWARMLADNIYNAVREEIDVLQGLESILAQSGEITKVIEADKKESAETELLVKVVCPLSFILMVWLAKSMVGYSWAKILTYEFTEPAGLFMFTVLVLLQAVNLVILPVLGKQKYDF